MPILRRLCLPARLRAVLGLAWILSGLALAAPALAQPDTGTAPAPVVTPALPLPSTAGPPPTIQQQIRLRELDLERAQLEAPFPRAAWVFTGLLFLFLLGSGWLVHRLNCHALARDRALPPDAKENPFLTRYMDLPLGAPEGTVRALLSIFIIVFGFLLLSLSQQLRITSGEALTGFIGAVISFYFASRANEQSRQAASAAASVAQKANEIATEAISAANTATTAATSAGQAATRAADAVGTVRDSGTATAEGAQAGTRLAQARETLDVIRIGLSAARGLLPPETAETATSLLTRVQEGVGAAERIARGEAGGVVAGAEVAQGLAKDILGAENPLVGMLGDALGGLRSAGAMTALAGIGGPPGLLIGVAFGAFQALRKGNEYYERWKARILARPYTSNLFPPGELDGAMCLMALEQEAPIFRRLFLDTLPPGDPGRLPRARMVAEAARLEDQAARAKLEEIAGGPLPVASEEEYATGLDQMRRALLDHVLANAEAGAAPVSAPVQALAGLSVPPMPPAVLRTTLDRLRENREAKGLDPALLLITGLAQSPDMTEARMATLLHHLLPPVQSLADTAQQEEDPPS